MKLEYFIRSMSVPWFLMSWLLTSICHQQQWYWIYRMNRSTSATRKDFNYLHHISVKSNGRKCKYIPVFSKADSAWQDLTHPDTPPLMISSPALLTLLIGILILLLILRQVGPQHLCEGSLFVQQLLVGAHLGDAAIHHHHDTVHFG